MAHISQTMRGIPRTNQARRLWIRILAMAVMLGVGRAQSDDSSTSDSPVFLALQTTAVNPPLESPSQAGARSPMRVLPPPRTASDPIVGDLDAETYTPYLAPVSPAGLPVPGGCRLRCGVPCDACPPGNIPTWKASQPIPWEVFAQGEYVGPARSAHVGVYRLRVDDILQLVYRLSGQVSLHPYRLNVRDRIRVESLSSPQEVDRDVIIQA